jgi:hypothetical protein
MFSTFKTYLLESKKTYSFRVKIAGNCPKQCEQLIKDALAKHDCFKVSKGTRTPIQETPFDFPNLKNMEVTFFDVECNYPTTSNVVRDRVGESLNIGLNLINVRNPQEQAELELNQEHMKTPGNGESLLEKEYETNTAGQDLVGEKHVSNFLKELSKINADRKAAETKTEGKAKTKTTNPEFEEPTDGRKSPLGAVKNSDPRKGKTK